jgi:hypothetical protein
VSAFIFDPDEEVSPAAARNRAKLLAREAETDLDPLDPDAYSRTPPKSEEALVQEARWRARIAELDAMPDPTPNPAPATHQNPQNSQQSQITTAVLDRRTRYTTNQINRETAKRATPKHLKPVFQLGFTNRLQDYTYKPRVRDWMAPTPDNSTWLKPIIQKIRFDDDVCDESNLSCKIHDLRMIECDFDNHHGVHTRDTMISRCQTHVQLLQQRMSDCLTVYQVMIQKETGSYKIRFLYSGTLLGRPGFEADGATRLSVLEVKLSRFLGIQENEQFELLARGIPGKNRTRVFSADHDIYDCDGIRLTTQDEMVLRYKAACAWTLSPNLGNLSSSLICRDPKPRFHRSYDAGEPSNTCTTARSIVDAIRLSPDDVQYGAGTRWDQLPYVCQYVGRCGYQDDNTSAWTIYEGLDHGSKDMQEDQARAKRDFFSCLNKTRSRPMDRIGSFASEAPDELLFDKGRAFHKKYSVRDQSILYAIAADILRPQFLSNGRPWKKALAAVPIAFELAFSKIDWEKVCPTTDRPDYLSGSATLNFGNKEKQLKEFQGINSTMILNAIARACLVCAINPETGREYNYLTHRHARCYRPLDSVERCLKRHLRLTGRSLTILEFNSLSSFTLLLDNHVVTPSTLSSYQAGGKRSEGFLSLEVDSSYKFALFTSKYKVPTGNLLKGGSFDLPERLREARDVLSMVKSVVYQDRYRILQLFKGGGSVDEVRDLMNRLRKKRVDGRGFGYSYGGGSEDS